MFKKYKFLFLAFLVTMLVFLFFSVRSVSAAVGTNQSDYSPGSVVTVSGDNSDGAGYAAGETVHVDANGPNSYSLSCDATADNNNGVALASGSSTVTVNDAGLSYFSAINTYTVLVNSSTGNIQVGKFLDANPGDNHSDFTITVHWGDGSSDNVPAVYSGPNGSQATYTITDSHNYTQQGSYIVTYDVVDDGGSKLTGIHTATVNVNLPATTTTVGSSLNPSTYGQSVTYTGTVTNISTSTAPSGSMEFFDGSTDLGAGTPGTSSGNQTTWTFTTSTLNAGSHTIKAVFSDGTNFSGSNGSITQTVNPKTLTITASSTMVTYGDAVPAIMPSYYGFITGDNEKNSLSTQPTCITTYTQGSGVSGSPYPTSCSGAVSTNYSFIYVPGYVTVNPATLMVTADDKTHQYSDPLPALTYQIAGIQNSDEVSGTASCSTAGTQYVQAGSYPIKCTIGTLSAPNYTFTFVDGNMVVTQEDAAIQYTGDTIAQVGTNLNLRATVWDSAASGYPGTPTGPVPDKTIGDITQMWIEFDIYPAGGDTPTTKYAQVSVTGVAGVGTATATYTSSSEASYYVVSRLVASSTGGTNQWYMAPNAESAAIDFYINSGKFATGGGWINDPGGSKGNFGFNARYNNSGKPQGQMVYVYRGMYNGVAADFIIKSNALTALQFVGSTYPITSTLQGKASIQINRASDGVQLYSAGNFTFTATVVDSGQSSGIGSDSFALTVYDNNGVLYHSVPTTLLGGGNVVIHLK